MDEADYLPVAPSDAVGDEQAVALRVAGRQVLLVRSLGVLHAIENLCPHAGQPLEGGRVRRGWIACSFHGARFDLGSGAPLGPLPTSPLCRFLVREVDGTIEVAV